MFFYKCNSHCLTSAFILSSKHRSQGMASHLPIFKLSGSVYIASDVHLGAHIPHTNQLFFQFLRQASQEADALILAGDIFNVWFGDDIAINSHEPWLRQSLAALHTCAQHIPLYFMHGNRDFLVGEPFCQSLGITLLPEQCLLQTDAGMLFLSHGDELCSQDKAYMRFRTVIRNTKLQHFFLSLPFAWRRSIANFLRNRSEKAHHKYHKSPPTHQSMSTSNYDVSPDTLQQIVSTYPEIDYVVHGHTHRQAIHPILSSDGKTRFRYVLTDWDIDHHCPSHWGFLSVNQNGLSFINSHH